MVPTNVVTWWREVWESESVVNHSLVTDPTIRQLGFDLSRRSWSILNVSALGEDSVLQTSTTGILPHRTSVSVVRYRQCATSWRLAHLQN